MIALLRSLRVPKGLTLPMMLPLSVMVCSLACQTQSRKIQRKDFSQNTKGKADSKTTKKIDPGGDRASQRPHVAMVIDGGFDVSHEVFKSKVLGQYTITCDEDIDAAPEWSLNNSSLDQAKTLLKRAYLAPKTGCKIADGIKFTLPSNFSQIGPLREKWNDGLKRKVATLDRNAVQSVVQVLKGREAGEFHGTNTAGLIGYQNPNVKLVLVSIDFSPRAIRCPTQRGLSTWVEAHRDPEVRRAYVEGPADSMEASLDDVVKKHGVTLVNMSFTRVPRSLREKDFADSGCSRLDFTAYYQLSVELERARSAYQKASGPLRDAPRPLAIQSAGNDSLEIDSIADSEACSDPGSNLLIAGSLDLNGQRSKFSNFGKCVDFYVLGAKVVVAAPDNFLNVVDGTSFSAPLLVRYISKEFAPGESAVSIAQKLKDKADATGRLQNGVAPPELAYEDDNASIGAYALTESTEAPPRKYLPHTFRWGGFR